MTTKFYSNKSNARRAALAAGLVIEACTLETDGKGFAYVPSAPAIPYGKWQEGPQYATEPTPSAPPVAAPTAADYGIPATPGPTEAPVTAGQALVQAITEGVEAGMAAEEAQPASAARKGIRIDKNRAEQNGIRRPSAGGKCAKIWDECDFKVASGVQPTIKGMKNWGTANGINLTTVTIQFYQWRAFNGIVGRQ